MLRVAVPSIVRTMAVLSLSLFWIGSAARAEPVTSYELKMDHLGYPCLLKIEMQHGVGVHITQSNYKGVWSLRFGIDGVPEEYQTFFDKNGLADRQRFNNTFSDLSIGLEKFDINEAMLYAVQKKDVGAKTRADFEVIERHNVARALEAMVHDGFSIPGLVAANNTLGAMSVFRSCAMNAMGLREGERVETDFRAEYRMIFEDSFDGWIKYLATAEACGVSRYDEAAVEKVISEAASAFYPGVLNAIRRREYRNELSSDTALLELSGITEAMDGGCFMARSLAEMARLPVDRAIEAAQNSD